MINYDKVDRIKSGTGGKYIEKLSKSWKLLKVKKS